MVLGIKPSQKKVRLRKVEIPPAGIKNLGNTCYMNDAWRKDALPLVVQCDCNMFNIFHRLHKQFPWFELIVFFFLHTFFLTYAMS